MDNSKHPNSHKVIAYRTGNFFMNSQPAQVRDEVMKMTRQGIGSYFKHLGSQVIGSGLNRDEINFLMPEMIGLEPSDKDFLKEVEKFFIELNTAIPYGSGKEWEIGLEINNSKPLIEYGKDESGNAVIKFKQKPLNPSDYIKYRHAMEHPRVAKSLAESKGNQLKWFYIYDPVLVEDQDSLLIDIKDKATEVYMSIKTNPGKVDAMLTIMGTNIREITGANFERKRMEKLREHAEKKPADFVAAYKDQFFEERYWIGLMVNTGVLHVVGDSRYLNKQNVLVGKNLLDTIYYLRDKENSMEVSLLKEQVQQIITLRSSVVKPEPVAEAVGEGLDPLAEPKVPPAPLPPKKKE